MAQQQIWYGGDYNPEQWPQAVWAEDVQLMQRAGVNMVTLAVFSWGLLEVADDQWDFGWLDRIMDQLHQGGIKVDLATATAAPPAWLVRAHPEILPVAADGTRLEFGSRQSYNPSSATYRAYATRLTRKLAERYGSHPALAAWHVGNEFGCHVARDYSAESAAAFRGWLERRYGTVEALNQAWGTAFWSQHYTAFDHVEPPRATPTFPNPTQLLDFDRFSSDALLECYLAEVAVLREVTPGVPITTNFMGFFKPVDYWRWAQEVDFVCDDAYPDPADPASPGLAAMMRDLMRSLGGGKPWILMEQAPSAVNWRERNAPKPAGQYRLWSLQAVARGADGVMQFQWRQSAAGAEKFHSGMVPHAGTETRVFREVEALGAELKSLAGLVGSLCEPSRVALVLDWDSWRALEQAAVPASLDYVAQLQRWHSAFWRRGLGVDFVPPEADLSAYDVVVAPAAHVLSQAARQNLAAVPGRGGQLVVAYQTGVLDPDLHVLLGGYLGAELREALGVWVEEFAPPALVAGQWVPELALDGLAAGPATDWAEVLHAVEAEVLATFRAPGALVDGQPAITRRPAGPGAGAGGAWYVATAPAALDALAAAILEAAGIAAPLLPAGVEVARRGGRTFVLNHALEEQRVAVDGAAVVVPGRDAAII